MTVLEGSPCMALSTKSLTVSKLASFIKPELRMAPAPAAHMCHRCCLSCQESAVADADMSVLLGNCAHHGENS